VLASQGHFAEAERELNEALCLDPNDLDAHYNLGNALIEQDRVAEAVPHYEQVLRLNPNHTGAREILERAHAYLNSSR
jgi:cytochrome c-type biogenesis protein CcmH/NrfG